MPDKRPIDPEICIAADRAPYPTGRQQIYRPKRSFPRPYRPSDCRRIIRYAACTSDPAELVCAVIDGLGKTEELRELIDKIDSLLDQIKGEDEGDLDQIIDELINAISRSAGKILRRIRFLRWILRRLFQIRVLLELLERIEELLDVTEKALTILIELRKYLAICACVPPREDIEEFNGP